MAKLDGNGEDEIEVALAALFRAYDLDESGELSREEFLAIEMRLHYEDGQVYRGDFWQRQDDDDGQRFQWFH